MVRHNRKLSTQPGNTTDQTTTTTITSLYVSQDQDNKEEASTYRSDVEKAGLISFFHFIFGFSLIRKINSLGRQPLTEDHLKPAGPSEDCQTLERLFTTHYYQSRTIFPRHRNAVYLTFFKIFKKDIFIQLLCQIIFGASRIATVYFLYHTLLSVRNPEESAGKANPYAWGMFLGLLLSVYSLHQFTFRATYTANKMKVGILGMIYSKITRLSLLSVHRANIGKILNVATSDANNLENIHYVLSIIVAPLIFGGAAGILYYFWRLSGLVGIGYMLVSWVLLQIFACLTTKRRRSRSSKADERIRTLNEFLEVIKFIKINAWEMFGFKTISDRRREEVQLWKRIYFLDAISRAIVFSSHWISIFLIFVAYTLSGHQITAAKIFPTILLMTYLRQICMIHVNSGISFIVQMKLYFDRIISIMDLPEVQPSIETPHPQKHENAIEFEGFTGFWPSRDLDSKALAKLPLEPLSASALEELQAVSYVAVSNINLEVRKGSLVMIIGKVGSGKSSLLMSFTREMVKSIGELRFAGEFELMPQSPLFLTGTIRDNITFGKLYDEGLFWRVIDACCLTDEVRSFPDREMKQVGERGISLNGRQKALIGLARSIYTKADIYLLDDPFSELDPALAKRVFNKVIQEFLRDKTVLLVTKDMNLLKYADKIIVMNEGKISEETWKELGRQGSNDYIEEIKDEIFEEAKTTEEKPLGRQETPDKVQLDTRKTQKLLSGLHETNIPCIDKEAFLEEEKLEEGKVTLITYWEYLKSIFNWSSLLPAILLFVGAESAGWQLSVRLANWAEGQYSDSIAYAIVGSIVCGGLMVHLFKFLLYFNSALNGTCYLHDKMLKGILNIPLEQFIRNMIGRILNRFSMDIAFLDGFLMMALLDVLEGFCLFMVFLTALWISEPWILLPAGIGLVTYLIIFAWCNKAISKTRSLARTTRSPLYSMFTATIVGLTTIRARKQSEDMIKAFYKRANEHSKANISYRVSLRFMSFVLDYITQLIIIGFFCYLIYQQQSSLLSGSFVNMLVQLPSTMQWLLINLINLHSYMASASRILTYCQKYKAPEDIKTEINAKDNKDPKQEAIELGRISCKFTDTDLPLLKNILLSFQPGEKMAIVGDTKASLSSIVYMLSTSYEAKKKSNYYDRLKTSASELHFLRDSMTIITEEAYLLTATIRDNLDLRKEYSDAELWNALNTVELKVFVEQLEYKLDTPLSKCSTVFSESQRQLLYIARALLRKTPILVQDKATNKINIAVDNILQKRIEENFKNATILTATNRLLNIAEYDKVLYVKSGVKHEFGEPYRLLVKEIGDKDITRAGGFARLVLDMDPGMSREIFRLAMEKYCVKHGQDFHLEQNVKSLGGISDGSARKTIGDVPTAPSLNFKGEEEK